MANRKALELVWPEAGVHKGRGFQKQPPYTTPDALNVRTLDVLQSRARGGRRPGTKKAFASRPAAAPIQALGTVSWVSSGQYKRTFVAIAGGQVVHDDGGLVGESGNLVAATGEALTWTSGVLSVAEKSPSLYIADSTPKVFSPETGAVSTLMATHGTVPTECRLCCFYRDRMVLAGSSSDPHLWYMSRVGDPTDWSYCDEADDPARAIAGNTRAGSVFGKPITAIAPWLDDYLILAGSEELWLMVNDPASGGEIVNASRSVGVLSSTAWTWGPSGAFVFLSRRGLEVLNPGSREPQTLSPDRLPSDLRDLSPATYTLSLAYDQVYRGIHIAATPATGAGLRWFYDFERGAFWPESYPSDHQPTAMLACPLYGSNQLVVLGCRDGYLRKYSDIVDADDGTAISAYCKLGPIQLDPIREAMILNMQAVIDTKSSGVSWELATARGAQSALSATARWSGSWSSAVPLRDYLRASGQSAALKLSGGGRWAFEQAILLIDVYGRQHGVE